MKTIAIIPARGKSNRLPNKNILLLGDIPLIIHSILFAQQHKNIIDEIYVSTDNAEIKQIANSYGVKVIDRPDSLSSDLEPTVSALKHVLESIEVVVETVVLLQPTNPLRPQNLLNDAYDAFLNGQYDSLMTVTRNQQKFGKIFNNIFIPFNYEIGQRSQDLEPLYFENGLLYIMKASLILEDKILSENNFPFIVDHPFAYVDIDTKEDFEYASYLFSKFINSPLKRG